MGGRMARRLVDAGYALDDFRHGPEPRSHALVEAGAHAVDSPAAVGLRRGDRAREPSHAAGGPGRGAGKSPKAAV